MGQRISPYLFHYTKATGAIAILREGKLRFSSLARCNDPYETKAWNFRVSYPANYDWNSAGAKQIPHDVELSRMATRIIRDRWQTLCFTGSALNDREPWLQGGCIPPMWAHYSENHTGACLILRWDEIHEAFVTAYSRVIRMWGWVTYETGARHWEGDAFMLRRAELDDHGLERALDEHAGKFANQLFLTKHTSWSYEQEYRFLARDEITLEIPIRKAIRGVYVGSDCTAINCRSFTELGELLNVEVRRMAWVNGNPLLGVDMLYQPPGFSRLTLYR